MLVDAIEQRDAVRAERAMHDHLMAQLAALKALQQLEARRATRPPLHTKRTAQPRGAGRRAG